MGIFSKKLEVAGQDVARRSSCSGCSSCFSGPIESMPAPLRERLEAVRQKLIDARALYSDGKKAEASAAAREVKRLVSQLASSGDFRSSIDSMFAAHVPEAEIQVFIARS